MTGAANMRRGMNPSRRLKHTEGVGTPASIEHDPPTSRWLEVGGGAFVTNVTKERYVTAKKMGRPRLYADAAARKRAQRAREKAARLHQIEQMVSANDSDRALLLERRQDLVRVLATVSGTIL